VKRRIHQSKGDKAEVAKHPPRRDEMNIQQYGGKAFARDDDNNQSSKVSASERPS
jgi:hypothetical protein